MSWRRVALAAGLLLLTAAAGAQAQGPGPVLQGLDGGRLGPAELESGPVILVTWTSWSPRCRDIVRQVNEIEARWGRKARVATVNFQEEPAVVRRFLEAQEQKLAAEVFLDRSGDFSKKHAVTYLPGLLIVRDGVTAFNGRLPKDWDTIIGGALQ